MHSYRRLEDSLLVCQSHVQPGNPIKDWSDFRKCELQKQIKNKHEVKFLQAQGIGLIRYLLMLDSYEDVQAISIGLTYNFYPVNINHHSHHQIYI